MLWRVARTHPRDRSSGRGWRTLRLGLSLRLLRWGLRQVFLQEGLKQNDDQKSGRKHQQQPAVHPGFLLRILKFCQSSFSVTANFSLAATSRSLRIAADLYRIVSPPRKRM